MKFVLRPFCDMFLAKSSLMQIFRLNLHPFPRRPSSGFIVVDRDSFAYARGKLLRRVVVVTEPVAHAVG